MPASVRIHMEGAREVHALLVGMERRTRDASPALRKAGDVIRREWREAFDTAGRNLPKPWRPVTEATRVRKARSGYDSHVLVRRGDLRDSMARRSHSRHIEEITTGDLRIGTKSPVVPLLRHHGRDPVQPPRDLTPIVRIIERWVIDEDL